MHHFRPAIPQSGPLCTGHHPIIGEQRVDVSNRILKDCAGIERLVRIRVDPLGEDQVAEYGLRVGRRCAHEFLLNGERDVRRRRHRRRIGYGGSQSDRGGQRDSRGEGDGGRECYGWGMGGCRCWREEAVHDRFCIGIEKE